MSKLYEKSIVRKRNVLNELRCNSMTLQELRFFNIYLSKINPSDLSTRVVRFPLDDFRRIMGLGSDMNITHFRYIIRHILQQVVEVPNEKSSGFKAFQLFKQAEVEKDENGDWYVEFDAHDNALPLMFEFKNKYLRYELWNALRLKSPNQVRMYEILKQYEGIGKRELAVTELRELLGIKKDEYSGRTGWSDFKKYVLDSCQHALKELTDISYTYERGKTGRGGKWLTVVFHISKNTAHKDPLQLNEFIEMQPKPEPLALETHDSETAVSDTLSDELREIRDILHEAVTDEDQLTSIQLALAAKYPDSSEMQLKTLRECYARYFRYSSKVKNPYKYILKIIDKQETRKPQGNQKKPKSSSSFDLDLIMEHAKNIPTHPVPVDNQSSK